MYLRRSMAYSPLPKAETAPLQQYDWHPTCQIQDSESQWKTYELSHFVNGSLGNLYTPRKSQKFCSLWVIGIFLSCIISLIRDRIQVLDHAIGAQTKAVCFGIPTNPRGWGAPVSGMHYCFCYLRAAHTSVTWIMRPPEAHAELKAEKSDRKHGETYAI